MKDTFTTENAAMLLIDHQVGTAKLARNIDHGTLVANTRALARVAVGTGMPLLLTTSQETNFQGRMFADLEQIAPDAYAARVKRPGTVDAWRYAPFHEAALAVGRKKLVVAGLTNDVCTVFPSISAVEEGYQVQVVVDAGGSPTQAADDFAVARMRQSGVGITGTNQILAELASDWSTEAGGTILGVMYEEILRPMVET
ncbi:MAG: isochorismatase family protein [Pseudomonadota bacterium]